MNILIIGGNRVIFIAKVKKRDWKLNYLIITDAIFVLHLVMILNFFNKN